MKKIITFLLAALCALLPAAMALAQAQESTTLKTTIPSEHTITIVCGKHGSTTVNGENRRGTFEIKVARLGTLRLSANADEGYVLSQVQADDLSGMRLDGTEAVFNGVCCDNTIILSFSKLPDAPQSTATPSVTPTPVPEESANTSQNGQTGNALYDDYLGSGEGLEQLGIVYDREYQRVDYELLDVKICDDTQGNQFVVYAYPNEEGESERRSLILSGAQMAKLMDMQQTERLIFANGNAAVSIDMDDLMEGDMRKLMGLILKGNEPISKETLKQDWRQIQQMELSEADIAKIRVEVRIIPVELADGTDAYAVSVWLRWGNEAVDVSEMIPSMKVCLNAEQYADNGAMDGLSAIGFRADAANPTECAFLPLESEGVLIPEELPETQADTAERFIVHFPENGGNAVVAYERAADLSLYRYPALCASFAGAGEYTIIER